MKFREKDRMRIPTADISACHGANRPTAQRPPAEVLFVIAVLLSGIGLLGFLREPENFFALLGGKVGGDFTNFWTAARLVLEGDLSPLFDSASYRLEQVALFGADFPLHLWSYPPHLLLFIWPFGAMPYEVALAVLMFGSWALYLLAARLWLPGNVTWGLFAIALAPASVANAIAGQTGFLTGALLLAGFWWLERRPVMSGLAFALLTFKPQLGILIPIVVLAGGHWRVLASAAIGTIVLFAASVLAFGWGPWIDFMAVVPAQQTLFLTHGTGVQTSMIPTLFMTGRILGLDISLTYALHAILALGVGGATYLLVKRGADTKHVALFVMLGAAMISPYAFNYDMTAMSLAAVLAMPTDTKRAGAIAGRMLWIALWVLPIAILVLNNNGMPIAPILLTLGLIWLWRHDAPGLAGARIRA